MVNRLKDHHPEEIIKKERIEHLKATIVGQVNGVMRPVVEKYMEELLKLNK